jgi:hypothetical protein
VEWWKNEEPESWKSEEQEYRIQVDRMKKEEWNDGLLE